MKSVNIPRRFCFCMRGRTFACVALFCLALSAANRSLASDVPGPLVHISVVDEHNAAVPDAKVELRLNDQVVASSSTDATGKATLTVSTPTASTPAVATPALYSLKIEKSGYLANESPLQFGDAVSTDQPTTKDIEVVLSAIALSKQSVEVKAEAENPITESSSGGTTLSPTQATETPLRPNTLVDALPLIAGIVRGPDGTVRIAGFGEDHSALLINSVDVTDPATGAFGLSVPIDSVQTVEVAETPYLAQYGRFTAGVVAANTRRGGDKWNYSLNDPLPDFFIRSAHLDGLRDATPRFNLSGPLIANHLYFLEGAEYLINKQEVYTLPFAQSLSTSKAINSFTQFDAIVSPTQTITGSFHFAPHSQQYVGLDYFNPQPVTPNASFHETTGTLTDRLAIGGGLLESTISTRIVSSGITPQAAGDMILSPTGDSGNYFGNESRRANRFEWIEQWTPRSFHFAGEHTLKFGGVLGHSENVGQFFASPVQVNDASGRLLQQIEFSGAHSYDLADTEPAAFAQDHWVLNSQLAIDAGLRLEGQTITYTSRAAPRAGLSWTPDEGKTVFRGGIGVFYDSVPLDVYAFSSYPSQTITTYNVFGQPIGSPVTWINLTSQAAQSAFPFVDRAQKNGNFAPYSIAWNVSAERAFSRFLLLRVKYIQSHEQDMITLQPEVVQGQSAFVLGGNGWARTRQAEVTAKIALAANRQFFFSYVRQYAFGDNSDANSYLGNYPFPVIRQSLFASLPSEIPNRFLLWGTIGLPRKFSVTPHFELRNGFPYQPTDVYQQYIAATSGPQYRYPRYFSFDLRASKEIPVDKKHAVRFSATVRNLTNHFNPLEVHSNTADPLYGTFFGNTGRRVTVDFDFLY